MLLDDTPTIGRITARDLLLGVKDIRDFASELALEVSDSQAEEIHDRTEGWAVAVALYLQNLKTGNDVTDVRDTDTLIYQLFWKKAPNRLQEVMLRLCLFEELTADQIRQVLPAPEGEPQELPYNLWESVPLLAYFPQRRQYFPHEILLTFRRRQLRQTDEGFRRECYQRAGLLVPGPRPGPGGSQRILCRGRLRRGALLPADGPADGADQRGLLHSGRPHSTAGLPGGGTAALSHLGAAPVLRPVCRRGFCNL